jgi:hypothetical protein
MLATLQEESVNEQKEMTSELYPNAAGSDLQMRANIYVPFHSYCIWRCIRRCLLEFQCARTV